MLDRYDGERKLGRLTREQPCPQTKENAIFLSRLVAPLPARNVSTPEFNWNTRNWERKKHFNSRVQLKYKELST